MDMVAAGYVLLGALAVIGVGALAVVIIECRAIEQRYQLRDWARRDEGGR